LKIVGALREAKVRQRQQREGEEEFFHCSFTTNAHVPLAHVHEMTVDAGGPDVDAQRNWPPFAAIGIVLDVVALATAIALQ
jgi:hypothetical protein